MSLLNFEPTLHESAPVGQSERCGRTGEELVAVIGVAFAGATTINPSDGAGGWTEMRGNGRREHRDVERDD
jgi:hypothetical protein